MIPLGLALAHAGPPIDHLAPGAPAPAEVLDLNAATWGVPLPNSVKAMAVAVDERTGLVYTMGSLSRWIMVTDPVDGHPRAAIDLGVDPPHTNFLVADPERRRLWWVGGTTEAVRVVDLDQGTVIAKRDPPRDFRKPYPVTSAALDAATGWLWVANTDSRKVTGYSPDLAQVRELPGVDHPIHVAAAGGGGALHVVDSASPADGRVLRIEPGSGSVRVMTDLAYGIEPKPPRLVLGLSDGSVVTAGMRVRRFGPDKRIAWVSAPLPEPPVAMVAAADTVLALVRDPSPVAFLLDAATGAVRAEVPVRHEARHAAADTVRGRYYVGNDGDGSVSVIDARTGAGLGTLDVANAAEGLVVDSRTGTRYVLDRLGGSEIRAWKRDGTLTSFSRSVPWPFELAIDPARRLLLTVGHFDGKLHRWDLDRGQELPVTDLGIPAGRGDSLADLDYDATTGRVAVFVPEDGWVAVADASEGRALWAFRIAAFACGPSAGPGRGFVEVAGDEVWVAGGSPPEAVVFDPTGIERRRVQLPVPPAGGAKRDALFFDAAGRRLFWGGWAVDSSTGALTQAPVDQVFFADADSVLAIRRDPIPGDKPGRARLERVVELDARTLKERRSAPLTGPLVLASEPTWDASSGRVYLCDLPRARVTAWEW